MGWLGWSEEQTLYSDVNAIIIGFRGRMRMIQAQNGVDPFNDQAGSTQQPTGGRRSVPSPSALPVLTPEIFDAMFPGK